MKAEIKSKRVRAIIDELKDQYMETDANCRPWIIGFSGGKDSSLFYMCAPDLLRYMKNDVDTDISYLFNNCGLDIKYPDGITSPTEGSQLMDKGITGRIPPYLLYNLSKIKTVSHMFTYCRRLSRCRPGFCTLPALRYSAEVRR